MTVKRALFAAILVSTAIFTVAGAAQNTTVALIAAALGVVWLVQEITERTPLNSLVFLVYTGLAAFGALGDTSLPLLLLGLSAALAGWDLSRFRRRIREEDETDEKTRLEQVHLQKLALVTVGGLLLALVPALLTISLNFVVLLVLMLIALLALRRSLLSLRATDKGKA